MRGILFFERILLLPFLFIGLPIGAADAIGPNLVRNGSFEKVSGPTAPPADWRTAGRAEVVQTLVAGPGRVGKYAAKLTCTQFVPGHPDSHAMIHQSGIVAVTRGTWYRLAFWAKGTGIKRSVCQVGLSDTSTWGDTGIRATFAVGPRWRHVERMFQAKTDVPAEHSRLQFWFASTGTLWLDDVVFEAVDMQTAFHPLIARGQGRNLLPNSSFECGACGWGSYALGVRTWAGNLDELVGDVDTSTAFHGKASLRLHHDKAHPPIIHWDYFHALVQPLHTLVTVRKGWIAVEPGRPCTLSGAVKADQAKVPVILLAREGTGRTFIKKAEAGTDWQRLAFTFTPKSGFLWVGIGLDLTDSPLEKAVVWLDALQLETGDTMSEYAPRARVESGIETAAGQSIVPAATGLALRIHLWNGTEESRSTGGTLTLTDAAGNEVMRRSVRAELAPGTSSVMPFEGLLRGRHGFVRAHWQPADHTAPYPQSLRFALIDPYPYQDSPFGMNHAYPWDTQLRACRSLGLTWMRDWSLAWETVQPAPDTWDFTDTDAQINRIVNNDLHGLALFPYASATWSSGGDREELSRQAGKNRTVLRRYIIACPAKDEALFRTYVGRTVDHVRDRIRHYEIMNEPLYTTYSVPKRFGYTLDDYLHLLRAAWETIKAEQPEALVIGGIGTWCGNTLVHDFIAAGGLQWCDIMDIHLYPATVPPESYEEELAECREMMRRRNQDKPIWLTEFGCYADDDPFRTPSHAGDATMNRSDWNTESAAAAALVKTSAVFLTYGVSKIFFHAGICGRINEVPPGGIFFEYDREPRKMAAALNALANRLGPRPTPAAPAAPPIATPTTRAYFFDTVKGGLAIAWATGDRPVPLHPGPGVTVHDIMGNPREKPELLPDGPPLLLQAADSKRLAAMLHQTR